MRSLYIPFLVFISVLFCFPAKAQEAISMGTSHTLFSHILEEEREYWVYVPENQSAEQKYPVLYLLDGDSFFHSVVGFTRLFSTSKVSSLSPCIIVAILNTDRTRDFTPSCSAARRDGTIHQEDKPEGGGAEVFYRFLTEELRPIIEKELPANGQSLLVGHSYAGLFTLNVLLTHSDAFNSYIAVDPSLWWDQGYLPKQIEQNIGKIDFSGKQLYVAFATQPRPDRKLIHFPLVDDFTETVIPLMERQHLHVHSRKFPEETHGTVALPGFYDGLKRLFFNYGASSPYKSRYNKESTR